MLPARCCCLTNCFVNPKQIIRAWELDVQLSITNTCCRHILCWFSTDQKNCSLASASISSSSSEKKSFGSQWNGYARLRTFSLISDSNRIAYFVYELAELKMRSIMRFHQFILQLLARQLLYCKIYANLSNLVMAFLGELILVKQLPAATVFCSFVAMRKQEIIDLKN